MSCSNTSHISVDYREQCCVAHGFRAQSRPVERLVSLSGAHVRDSLRARHEGGDLACSVHIKQYVSRRSTCSSCSKRSRTSCLCLLRHAQHRVELLRRCVALSLFVNSFTASSPGVLWQAHVRPCPHYGGGRGGGLDVRRRLETRLQR